MENLICTWLDVIDEIPSYFDYQIGDFVNITKGLILEKITKEEAKIRAKLRSYYGNNLSINSNKFYTTGLLNNSSQNQDFIFDSTQITVNTKFTQVYKFEFTEDTQIPTTNKVKVTPDVGAIVNGDITSSIDLTKIVIGIGAWGGRTFYKGDTFYLAFHHYEKVLVSLVAKSAAIAILTRTNNSQLATDSSSATELRNEVDNLMKMIMDPNDNLLEIGFKDQDLNPIEIPYEIDEFGNDNTEYL